MMLNVENRDIRRLPGGDLAEIILSVPVCRFALVRRGCRPAEWIPRADVDAAVAADDIRPIAGRAA